MLSQRQIIRARYSTLRYSISHCLFMKIRSRPAVPKSISSTNSLCRPTSLPALLSAAAALAALLAGGIFVTTQPASAQQGFGNFFTYQKQRPKRTAKRRAPKAEPAQADAKSDSAKSDGKKQAETKSGPTQPVYVVVSLADQHATVYDRNGYVTRTRISTGQAGHRTPTGLFTIIGKSRYHRSNIYSGAPMPFMQRITWSGVAMHAGVVPGYPASHGCIRLPSGFAPQLYKMTEMGARVVVSPRDVQPVEFSHPFLPLPKMQLAPEMPQTQQAATAAAVELASTASSASTANEAAPNTASTQANSRDPLNPIAYATALKKRAQADKSASEQSAKTALEAAQAAGAEARQAADDLAKATAALTAAEASLAALDQMSTGSTAGLQPASVTPAATDASPERATAEAEVKRVRSALAEAQVHEAEKSAAAFAAVNAWKSAAAAAEAASDLVDEADRRRQRVSVLISRKEGRVFIRQDWKEVWEAPVTIRDPDRPIGTHVYSAIDAAADGSSMRWISISMPPESAASGTRRGNDSTEKEPAVTAETAAGALDRIELSDAARERIAELLWTGGSLIVSDQPRSPEMSEDATDFIVLTR
jgi:lipoprotein-anchoring transpeptidase ErfK/SrfK